MFASVSFYAPQKPMLVIPGKALHQGRVYVAKPDNRLEIRSLEILYRQGEFVVVKQGLKEGEKLVISDVIPVIEDLPLRPVQAGDFVRKFEAAALGVEALEP